MIEYFGPERRQELFAAKAARLALPMLASVLVGIGSAAITGAISTAKLEERVIHLERSVQERIKEDELIHARETDFERRISKNEATIEHMAHRLDEIAMDIKSVLRVWAGHEPGKK